MSTLDTTPTSVGTDGAGRLDLARVERTPFSRLLRVELRKMFDTRAGFWLVIGIGLLTALVMLIQIWVAAAQDIGLSFTSFLISMSIPMGVLLPVLGILSVSQEWGQRTGLVTFVLEPVRSRVLAAKLAGGVLVGAAAVGVALGLAVAGNLIYAGVASVSPVWNGSWGHVLGFLVLQVLGVSTGFVLGMLLMNTAAAVVVYFVYSLVVPGLFDLGSLVMSWLHDARPWLDFNFAQNPLADGSLTGTQFAQLLVSSIPWFVLPALAGAWRVLRSEVK